jgi:transposase
VVGVFPSAESLKRLVGSVLIDVNEEWLEMSFIDDDSLKDVRRNCESIEPSKPEVVKKAETLILVAIEAKRKVA